jgi:mannose-6-phosphate isomerase-like protein (cupin superfamily)
VKIINIDDIPGRDIHIADMTRTIKDILVTDKMTAHLGIVPPGQSTSEHAHPTSEEIVYIVKGAGSCKVGDQMGAYKSNSLIFVPEGVPHQYTNTGSEDMILFAVYSPPAEVPKT